MPTEMEHWELVARESIRNAIGRYAHAGDRVELADFVDVFCEDGVLVTSRGGPFEGRAAIAAVIGGPLRPKNQAAPPVRDPAAPKRFVRHNVSSIHIEEVTRETARARCYFTVFSEIGLDHFGRYFDQFACVDGIWRIKHRRVITDWMAPSSGFVS